MESYEYEILNPSDRCYITTDDDRIACVVGLPLGNGRYGMRHADGRMVLPILFNSWHSWFSYKFGEDMQPFMLANAAKVANALSTFRYAGERSSLNDIGRLAAANAQWLRELKPLGLARDVSCGGTE